MISAKMIPEMKMARAYGKGRARRVCVKRRARNEASAHRRLSAQDGDVHPKGWRSVVPADVMRESPAPTWMPFTTGMGMARVNVERSPVTLKSKTARETNRPAEVVCVIVKCREMATAAMACGRALLFDLVGFRGDLCTYLHRLNRQRYPK